MKRLLILGAFLAACAPFNVGGNPIAQGSAATYTPNPTYTVPPPYPTYTPFPTFTPPLPIPASNTPVILTSTFTPYATAPHYHTSTPFSTNTPYFTSTVSVTSTPIPTETGTQDFTLVVEVITDKTVLREIKEYNKKGYPIMRVREPRIRYDKGERIEVYAFGGENGGALYRSDGLDYYYKVYDSDGQEEELYVPSWHVAIVDGTIPTPETSTPVATSDATFLYVRVSAEKTVLRVVESYNDDGTPVMIIREPRIRYDRGELIPVYINGGFEDGYKYFYDGTVFYFKVFDSDGQEEDLYVVSWHVEIVVE